MASSCLLGRKQHPCRWERRGLWGERWFFFFSYYCVFFFFLITILFWFLGGGGGGEGVGPFVLWEKGEPQCLVLQSHATKPHCIGSEQYRQQGRLRDYSGPYPNILVVPCVSVSICVYCTDETKTLIFPPLLFFFEIVITALTQTCARAVDVSPSSFSAFEKDRHWGKVTLLPSQPVSWGADLSPPATQR